MLPTSPTIAQWELTVRLRSRRKELGMSSDAIARAAGVTRSYWSSVENDRNLLTEEKLSTIIDLFGFDADQGSELLRLRRAAVERGWWSDYTGSYDEIRLRHLGMEHGATVIRTYRNLLIPDLLQCEPYARATIASDLFVRPAEVDELVQIRLRRQHRLGSTTGPRLTALINEASLRTEPAGPTIRHTQLRHLAELIRGYPDTIEIRVLPFTAAGTGVLGMATFDLLDFQPERLPTLGWYDSIGFTGFVDNPRRVHDLDTIFRHALGATLTAADSLALIKELAEP